MAEDSDLERTESPSQRRLEQAREEGQIARSQELSTFAVLLAGGAGLWLMGPGLLRSLSGLMREGLVVPREAAFEPSLMVERLVGQGGSALFALLPLLGLVFAAAIGSPMLLNGWMFTTKGLSPDFGRINPMQGFSRIFSSHGLVLLGKAVGKTLVVGSIAVWVVWHNHDAVLNLMGESVDAGMGHLGSLVLLSFIGVAAGMLPIVLLDVPYQLWDHHRKLRMTKEELRQEARETEGDPHVKARIRTLQREAARKRMMAEVPKADVVVTNPTRFAVALRYDEARGGAPRVIAKGTQRVAARIREIATEHRVPIVEAPPLARALYRHSELGDQIPEALYAAVAEVLAYVYQLRRYTQSGGRYPEKPHDLPVPPGLDPEASPA